MFDVKANTAMNLKRGGDLFALDARSANGDYQIRRPT
jgi:hypothetical protein